MTLFTDVADAIIDGKTDVEIYAMHNSKNKGKVRRALEQLRRRLKKDDPGNSGTITRLAAAHDPMRVVEGEHAGAGVRVMKITLPRVMWLERQEIE